MFPKYPYLDLSDRNLDMLTRAIQEMENEVKNFVSLNAVKYANPIQWSINRQYEKNTIVIDPMTGTAFISVQPVPNGVGLTRTQYWTPVFVLSQFVTKAASNFANTYERDITTTATMPTSAGDWIVWDSTLYVALTSIHAGDAYVVNGNIKRMTVEDFYDLLMDAIHNLDDEIDVEIRNRTNADGTLQDNIDAEALARQNADGTLQVNIDAEALARQNADIDLQHDVNLLKRYINVKEYGAKGDGVTDDTTAILEAFDAIDDSRRVVYFPTGKYMINDTLDFVNLSNFAIVGDGHSSIIETTSNKPVIKFNSCHHVLIRDIRITRSVAGSGDGILYHTAFWSQWHTYDNVYIDKHVTGLGAPDSRLGVSYFVNCTFINNVVGASLIMNNDIFITNCNFTNNTNVGLSVGGSNVNPSDGGVWCTNCMAYANGAGIALNGTNEQHVNNFNWTGGIIDASTSAIASVYMTYADDVNINTKVSWGNGHGILIANCERVKINALINDCSKAGVLFNDTNKYIDLDCDIRNCSTSSPNTYHGIDAIYSALSKSLLRGLIYRNMNTGVAFGASCEYNTFTGAIFEVSTYYNDTGNDNYIFNRNQLNGGSIVTS